MIQSTKIFLTFILVITLSNFIYAQGIGIIPQPNHVEITNKAPFELSKEVTIVSADMSMELAKNLQTAIGKEFGIPLGIDISADNASILFARNTRLAKESYQLEINSTQIRIVASGSTGWFYGIQSLKQLLRNSLTIPTCIIKDEPRFSWRAYMLDESRYFQGEAYVKMILEEMALLKMNVFHWHLTDDAGWRIEIKKYPKLTTIGSQRNNSQIGPKKWQSTEYSGQPHGGFYTQKQIKNIVQFAKERNITIIPEFEMPGHSSAAIASYPWLGTAGKKIDVPIKFGRHYDIYDVTNPKVIQFAKDVLNELFELFPSEVIHIGGDEVGYEVWNKSKKVKDYMKEKGLNTPADLQIYYTNNISKFIEENGRRMMGWNEIMGINIHKGFEEKKDDKEAETELAKNVVVHFWKGDLKLATEAAKKGYQIVNSLHSNTYLDYSYKTISLRKAYDFDPIPKGLEEKFHKNIFGLGCQMWTEWTPTTKDVEYQTFPRIAAFAEVGWTTSENKDYAVFENNLRKLQVQWKEKNINFANVLDSKNEDN